MQSLINSPSDSFPKQGESEQKDKAWLWWDGWALLGILVLAALMRFGALGVTEFLHDEALLSLLAQDMVAGKGIPNTGIPSSVGLPNPPESVYVLAIPYAISSTPQFATLFIAALNVAGVGLLWWLARKWFGGWVALAAGILYAANPWAVLYSRKIWAQDFHTPFILLALVLGLYGFREGKRWAQLLCLPILFIGLQIHFAAWALLPVFMWLIVTGYKRVWLPGLVGSIVLTGMVLLPFAAGLSDTLTREPYRLTNLLNREGGTPLTISADALGYNTFLATGLGLETWVAPEQQADVWAKVPPPALLWLPIVGFCLFGIVGTGRYRWQLGGLLMLWALLPLLVFSLTWTPVYPHYFIASIPAWCLLAGIGVQFIIELGSKIRYLTPARTTPYLATLVGVIALTQIMWWFGLLNYVNTTATPNGFGPPMQYLLDVRNAANARDVLVISDGFEVLYDQEPAIWSVMMRSSTDCVRTITGDGLAVFPVGSFDVITAPNAPENPVGNLYHSVDEQVFPLRPSEGEYRLDRFASAPAWTRAVMTPIQAVTFGGGAVLTGYHLQADRLYLEWELPGAVNADYHYFGHFLNGNGEKIGQADHILWPGRFWCEGDRLISWVDAVVPEGTETLRVGLYELVGGGFRNESILDSAGNPSGQWVDIPLGN